MQLARIERTLLKLEKQIQESERRKETEVVATAQQPSEAAIETAIAASTQFALV